MVNQTFDMPLVEAIDYFSGLMEQIFNYTSRFAFFFGVLGLIWSAFRLITSKMEMKEFAVDTLYKWGLFVLLVAIYPMLTAGISNIANKIGIELGGGKEYLVQGLNNVRTSIINDVESSQKKIDEINENLAQTLSESANLKLPDTSGLNGNLTTYAGELKDMKKNMSSQADKDKIDKAIKAAKDAENELDNASFYQKRLAKAIDSVLVRRDREGNATGENNADVYLDVNLWLVDKNGQQTNFISPSCLMKVAILNCQLMFTKNKLDHEMAKKAEGIGPHPWIFFEYIINSLLTLLCCLFFLIAIICAILQYVMTIVEYTIIVGLGSAFLAFVLFDGTKDMAKKLVPVFTAFFIKFIVINVCLMFVFYLIVQGTISTMTTAGMASNFFAIGERLFVALLCFVLTQNAPKIAQTLLTGQPQLSMGEMMAAAGTAAMAGRAAAGGAALLTKGAGKATGAGVNAVKNKVKDAQAGHAAKKEAGKNEAIQNMAKGNLGGGKTWENASDAEKKAATSKAQESFGKMDKKQQKSATNQGWKSMSKEDQNAAKDLAAESKAQSKVGDKQWGQMSQQERDAATQKQRGKGFKQQGKEMFASAGQGVKNAVGNFLNSKTNVLGNRVGSFFGGAINYGGKDKSNNGGGGKTMEQKPNSQVASNNGNNNSGGNNNSTNKKDGNTTT